MIKQYLKALKFQDYEARKDRVSEENRSGIALILLFYSVILLLNIAGEFIHHENVLKNVNLVLELIYMMTAVPLYFFVLRRRNINFTFVIYLFEIPLLLIAILHGTFWDPDDLTFTFLLFLLVLPLLILDKPWRLISFIVSMTLVFIIADVTCKEPALFSRDLMHAFNTCLMSVAASLYTLAVRIQNLEYAGFFAEKADRDPLTGLYNRFGAERHLKERHPGLVIYMDLDRFKEVNDDFGHEEGDRVLKETADVLKSSFRKDDILIRMGGDEFAVFAQGEWTEEQIQKKLKDILQKTESIHATDGVKDIAMTVSIGSVYTPDGLEEPGQLLRKADQEMYLIKKNGKNNFRSVKIEKEAS